MVGCWRFTTSVRTRPPNGACVLSYRRFVLDGVGVPIWENLRQQISLGAEEFVDKMRQRSKIQGDALSVPRAQRHPPAPPLSEIASASPNRNAAIVAAYETGTYSYRSIAEHFGIHVATVGRIVRQSVRTRVQQYENPNTPDPKTPGAGSAGPRPRSDAWPPRRVCPRPDRRRRNRNPRARNRHLLRARCHCHRR
jgi:transposase-like protein